MELIDLDDLEAKARAALRGELELDQWAFIAAANPAAVLELVAEVRRSRFRDARIAHLAGQAILEEAILMFPDDPHVHDVLAEYARQFEECDEGACEWAKRLLEKEAPALEPEPDGE